MEIPIVAALAGAVAGGVFSLLNQILVDRRKRREEARLRHLQRQIEELYGPLYGLIQFGAAINEAEWLRLPKESRDENGWPRDEQGGKVLQFFRERYYLPLNEQMLELIRTRIHLLDSDASLRALPSLLDMLHSWIASTGFTVKSQSELMVSRRLITRRNSALMWKTPCTN